MQAEDRTRMFHEAAQAPQVVRVQLERNARLMAELGTELCDLCPAVVVTCARGSSDHAATFARYLIETRADVLTSSAAPSVSSVYAARPDLGGTVFIVISQSGASPDLLASVENARRAGARVIALVNVPDSPLARAADHVVPLWAGPETSVAATKSYIASLAAIIHLVASWTRDNYLLDALSRAPDLLTQAWELDWSTAARRLQRVNSLYVIGRGHGLGVAQEAALKLKETCGLHAEAFSAAEVRHGPMALVRNGFPVLLFAQADETRAGIEQLAAEFVAQGAQVMLAGAQCTGATLLPTQGADPAVQPMLWIQSFYRMANTLSLARGFDPDRPPHLRKVTETV